MLYVTPLLCFEESFAENSEKQNIVIHPIKTNINLIIFSFLLFTSISYLLL